MDQKLKEFFKDNEVRIGKGKDLDTIPPIYYVSLRDAFQSYFMTFRDKRKYFDDFSKLKDLSRERLAFDYTGADDYIVFTILSFHRFFELLIKDVLRRIDPKLAVKLFEKDEEIFQFLDQSLNIENVKTVEFSETIKRFKHAYKHYSKTSDVYLKHLAAYEFFIDTKNADTLTAISDWRNRIMHNGATLPNVLAFEYLISQRIMPLIVKVLEAEKPLLQLYYPHYLVSPTGIDILVEATGISFSYSDFSDEKKHAALANKILKLQHLKEIGRATHNQDPHIRNNRLFYEHLYENPIHRVERFAECEKEARKDIFYSLNCCGCCGIKSLVVYKREHDSFNGGGKHYNSWLKCFNCDYFVTYALGDPHDFGLAKTRNFPPDKEMAEVIYKINGPDTFTKSEKKEFCDLLVKQNKVVDPTIEKIERCTWLCICQVGDRVVSIGAIKPATKMDFNRTHADLAELSKEYDLELGYCYTEPDYTGNGYSSTIVNLLLEKESKLMASTETRDDNPMIYVLRKFGFKECGKSWKSIIHGGSLGLYLREVK
jgi:hypothetical protein